MTQMACQRVFASPRSFLFWGPLDEELHGNPQDQDTARKFDEFYEQELGGKKVRITLSSTAAPAPKMIPFRRSSRDKERTAMAMTTALSPARMRSMMTMLISRRGNPK